MNHDSPPNNDHSLFPKQDFDTEDDKSWQISYLDIFTILLGFMFVLLSLTDFSQITFTSISHLFESSSQQSEFITTPIDELKEELEARLQEEIERGELEIVRDLNNIRIRFSSDDLYRSGSATLQISALDLLDRVLEAIKTVPYDDFHIDVEGHTDSTPISSQTYPSNWELSTARASKIVKYFTHLGIKKQRLKASGYADSQPRVPNEDSLGNPLPENKDKNRRIVLRLYYTAADTHQSDAELASATAEQTPDTGSTCQYTVQAGSFTSFPNSFNFVRNVEATTDLNFDITYNGQLFSVRTKPVYTVSEALDTYRTVSPPVDNTAIGLIHQCYSSEQAIPEPLDYQIQFGAFESQNNADAYMVLLSDEHQISTHIAAEQSPLFKVVSGDYNETEAALAKLNLFQEKQLSNDIFIDYISTPSVTYDYDVQLQLGTFATEEKAVDFSDQITSETGIETTVTQYDGNAFYVVTRTFTTRNEALSLNDRITNQMPRLSPVVHLLEFIPPPYRRQLAILQDSKGMKPSKRPASLHRRFRRPLPELIL